MATKKIPLQQQPPLTEAENTAFSQRLAYFARPRSRGRILPTPTFDRSSLDQHLRQDTPFAVILTEVAWRGGVIETDQREQFKLYLSVRFAEWEALTPRRRARLQERPLAADSVFVSLCREYQEVVADRRDNRFDDLMNRAAAFGGFVVASAADWWLGREQPIEDDLEQPA